MTYTFHNRFTVFEERINIDVHTYELADTDHEHVIMFASPPEPIAAGRETMIKETGDLVLEGSGYTDEATAVAAARRWRRALTVAFARSHIGVDFGPDDRVAPEDDVAVEDPPEYLRRIGIQPGDRILSDAHRLLVFKSDPRPKILLLSGRGVVTRGLDQFESTLNDTRPRIAEDWSAEKTLAYRLVHAALRDTNPETQHIQLITAVEVLLKQQDRPPAVLEVLNGFIDEVEERPADADGVRKRLLEILRENLNESISQSACDQLSAVLTDTYDGKAVDVFYKRVYNMRSRMLHRKRRPSERRPTATELGEVHFELLRLVLDFLEASE